MYEFLWLNLNWPVWLFLVAVAISVAVSFSRLYRGYLLLALVLYLGVQWEAYWWVVLIFWVAWIAGILGVIAGLRDPRKGAGLAGVGSAVALFISVILALSALPSWIGDRAYDDLKADITSQLQKTDESVESLNGSLNSSDTAQAEINESVEERLDKIEQRLSTVESDVDKLENRVDKLESGVNMTSSPAGSSIDKTSTGLARSLANSGFSRGDIRIGTVNWDANPMDAGTKVFGDRIESRQELRERLNGSSAESRAVRQHLLRALPAFEHTRALSGKGHVPVQFLRDVCDKGNMYYKDGKSYRAGVICRDKGDIVWVYIDRKGNPVWDASVRADCSNPGYSRPPTPKAPKPPVNEKPKPTTPPSEETPKPKPKPTEESPKPSTPPNEETPKPTTPPSEETPKPTPTPTITPSTPPTTLPPGKDPSKDPENQGNNKPGGGGLAPPITGPASPPAAGNPPATYTPPPTPVATSAPGSTPEPSRSIPPNQGAPTTAPVPSDGPSGPACDPAICGD